MSVRETFCHYFGVVLRSSCEKKEATSRQSVNVISREAATFSRKPPVFVPEPKPYLALKRCEEGRHLRRRPLSRKCNCGTGRKYLDYSRVQEDNCASLMSGLKSLSVRPLSAARSGGCAAPCDFFTEQLSLKCH